MIRQPVQAEDGQQVGGRLRFGGQEFCAEQHHPSVPTLIVSETVNLPGPHNQERSGRTGDLLEVQQLSERTFGHADQRMEG